ncbi:MAG: class I SAM-dependent DNA methyltransferase [Bacteroidia bacterium]
MNTKTSQVKDFFHGYAGGFDSIYGHNEKRSAFGKWVDKKFRQTMFLRFQETLKNTKRDEIKSVLDVGCGPGRYIMEFLLQGKEVLGIDLAQGMLDIAEQEIKKINHKGSYKLMASDYLEAKLDKKYDAACLMGFFDYIEKPEAIFEKLKEDVNKEIYASFPHDTGLMAMQRKFRYKMRNCPLYYYTLEDVKRIMKNTGLENYEIIDFKRDYFVKVTL